MTEESTNKMGVRIREARLSKGLSAKTLASKLGVEASEISKWEHGKRRPQKHLPALARVLTTEVEYLTTGRAQTTSEADPTSINLAGHWMTHFMTKSSRSSDELDVHNFTVERIEFDRGLYIGKTLESVSSRKTINYRHTFEIRIKGDFAVVMWKNFSTRHFGVGLLHIHRDTSIMTGQFLGGSSTNVVDNGPWSWCRIDMPSPISAELFAEIIARKPAEYWQKAIRCGGVTLKDSSR